MEQNWYSNQLISIYNCHFKQKFVAFVGKKAYFIYFCKNEQNYNIINVVSVVQKYFKLLSCYCCQEKFREN